MWEYPHGRIEIRAAGQILAAQSYDRVAEIDQGAIVDHKRLSHVLQVAQAFQAQHDGRRIGTAPSRTHRRLPVREDEAQPGTKKPRRFTAADMETLILEVTSKPGVEQRSAKARG
ncbi:hypothetical protein [Burkholderia multivorans]|uniref:hypothetical protein n=1 Tax=Burkholderia multivorans TaxID=87883 RepID=UPI0021C119D2|nr:hypothetical protein [Burkholderia multivorans]